MTHVRVAGPDAGVQVITLDRADKLNALTDEMALDLLRAIDDAGRDERTGAVVLTGSGRAFCAGADLASIAPHRGDTDERPSLGERVHRVFNRTILAIAGCDKPVLAAVNGIAAGYGLSLALACDLRFAARSSELTLAFARLGLVPDGGATVFLPRFIGRAHALEAAWRSSRIDAVRASELGLVDRVIDDADLLSSVRELGAELAAGSRTALTLTKRAMRASELVELEKGLDLEAELQDIAWKSGDFAEAYRARIEGRVPRFTR